MEELIWNDLVNGESDVDAEDINKLANYVKRLNENKPDKSDISIDVDGALSLESANPVQNKVVAEALEDKVDKVEGKGLSTNDFTNAYKAKLDNNTFDYAYRFENEERYLDEIFDDFTTNGLYKLYYSSPSDDEKTHNIILSVTSAGVYGNDGYEGEVVFQTKYDDGYIATRQRDVEENWGGWSKVSVSSSDVTKEINKAIGDVETSLENIIEKYGLGGAK